MIIEIVQPENDKTNYLERICGFLKARGINTREQLELRFDVLMAEFAMAHHGSYEMSGKKLTIKDKGAQ